MKKMGCSLSCLSWSLWFAGKRLGTTNTSSTGLADLQKSFNQSESSIEDLSANWSETLNVILSKIWLTPSHMQKCFSNGHLIRYQGHKWYAFITVGRPAPRKTDNRVPSCAPQTTTPAPSIGKVQNCGAFAGHNQRNKNDILGQKQHAIGVKSRIT